LVQEIRQALRLRRALTTVDGRFWPREAELRPVLALPAAGPAFFREGQAARSRALDVISALAAAHPEQAIRFVDQLASALPGDDDWLVSTTAYAAAVAAAPADAERAGQLAAVIRDETRRGLAWEQVGRAYLQKGDWARAV